MKNVTVAKYELVLTRYRQNLKTVGNLTAINPLQAPQEFNVNEMYLYTLRIGQPTFESVEICSVFIIFECSHEAVFKIYRFQNVPAKNLPFSCERRA